MGHHRVLCVISCVAIWCLYDTVAHNHKLTGKSNTIWNMTATDRLKHDLLLHYDKFARPTEHYNTTTVNLDLRLYHFSVNELRNTFTVYGLLRLEWKDEKLKWKASDYEGLKELNVADHEIWQPDIVPYNSETGSTVTQYANTLCIVYEDGTIVYVPHVQFDVFCQLDLTFWPFDEQNCFVRIGSWTYHVYAVNLTLGYWQPNTDKLLQNTEWRLLNVSRERREKTYACCKEPFPEIRFNYTIRRASSTYKALVITPSFAIITMTLVNFWLPPYAGEKLLLNCCTTIIICIFLLFFSQKTPALKDHTPLLISLYSNTLYTISFCFIGSIIVIWITRTQHQRSLPRIINQALSGCFGRWLGLSNLFHLNQISHCGPGTVTQEGIAAERDESHDYLKVNTTVSNNKNKINYQEWLLLATAIDRISFVFYVILLATLVIQTLI